MTKICRTIIDDVEKLDGIQDGFIHYQILRFCQTTRLQYLNSYILLGNRYIFQKDHVDCKIAEALLKKGTKEHADDWDASRKTRTYMVVSVAWLDAFPQERQVLWLPKDDFRDSSTWSSPPLVLLSDIHSKVLPTTMMTVRRTVLRLSPSELCLSRVPTRL